MSGRTLAALAAALLALPLSACGGGEGSSSTAATEAGPHVSALSVSGGGSAQFRVKGGDNSIVDYGAEASRAELRAAATVLHDYFAGLATESWGSACKLLSAKVAVASQRLASAKETVRSCAQALGLLFGEVSAAEGREASEVDAVSLRTDGTIGFLIYRGANDKPFFAKLRKEDGRWVVDGLSPSSLG